MIGAAGLVWLYQSCLGGTGPGVLWGTLGPGERQLQRHCGGPLTTWGWLGGSWGALLYAACQFGPDLGAVTRELGDYSAAVRGDVIDDLV